MVPAFHSSAIIKDGAPVTMGDPAGFVIQADGTSVYHTGDTALFSDMALIQRLYQPKVGLSASATGSPWVPRAPPSPATSSSTSRPIVPIHWGTFPLLTGQPEDFKRRVKRGRVHVATPGEPFEV